MVKNANDKNPVSFCLPGSLEEEEEKMIREQDSSLDGEERAFVLHYLRLAAMFLGKEPAASHSAVQEHKPQEKKLRLEGRKAA
jgi:hypothetical protein